MQPPDTVDALIVRLIRDDRAVATPADVAIIVARIASAPFNRRPVRVPGPDRGLAYGGVVIGRTADPLDVRLAKRVVRERQWVDGTTVDEYLADLRASARHPAARVLVYERSGEAFAATISLTTQVVPSRRRGTGSLPLLLVVYSASYGVVRSAYMYSDFSELDMPEAIRWLR